MTDCIPSPAEVEDPTRKVADDLATALHRCSAFLPLFIEEGPRLQRALAAHAEVDAALDAYCSLAGIRRVDLNRPAVCIDGSGRMAVSRRLRFEVLRRDGHTCRYCGAKAPDVVLTVDHVIPVTLGGGDDPANLVTACEPCNSGKASVSPESELVEDVDAAAMLWAKAMERAHEMRRLELHATDQMLAKFDAHWQLGLSGVFSYGRPDAWDIAILRFLENGLTLDELMKYVDVAFTARINPDNVWRYFCGCCWREVTRRQELARTLIEDGEV